MSVTGQDDVARPTPAGTLVVPVAIAVFAVTIAAVAARQSAFLIVAVCIPLAIVALMKFDWYFCAVVFLIPWNPTLDWKLPVRDVSLLAHAVLFCGVWIIRKQRGKSIKTWLFGSKLKQAVLLLGAVAAVSLALSPLSESGAFPALAKLLSYIALFFAAIGWLESREQIIGTLKLLLLSAVGVALFGFYQALEQDFTPLYFRMYPMEEATFDAQGGWAGRITSFLFHYNALAGYLNVVIPVAIGATVLAKERWLRYLGFVCITTAVAALYLTGSRGGLIALGGALSVTVWYLVPRRATIAVLLCSAVLSAAIALPLAPRESSQERLQSVDDFTQESRLALWGAAGLMFLSHPVLGVGYGNYKFLLHAYVPGISDDLDSHNLYLQLLAETGIVGFLAFFVLLGAFARIGLKLRKTPDPYYRAIGVGVCGALVATLLHGFVDFIFGVSPQFGNVFWLVLALGCAAVAMAQDLHEPTASEPAGAAGV